MTQEQWKPIKDYEGLYEISNYGRVKSIDRYVDLLRGSIKIKNKVNGRIFKWVINLKGYPVVGLSKGGLRKSFLVHNIVWDMFGHGQRVTHKMQVDHIDENKQNACISNLRLVSNRQNVTNYHLGRKKSGLPICVHLIDEKRVNKYTAQISVKGKVKRLGVFPTIELASQAYQTALKNIAI